MHYLCFIFLNVLHCMNVCTDSIWYRTIKNEGRAFGQAFYDDSLTLLAISQCCVIRSSTLRRLLRSAHSTAKNIYFSYNFLLVQIVLFQFIFILILALKTAQNHCHNWCANRWHLIQLPQYYGKHIYKQWIDALISFWIHFASASNSIPSKMFYTVATISVNEWTIS